MTEQDTPLTPTELVQHALASIARGTTAPSLVSRIGCSYDMIYSVLRPKDAFDITVDGRRFTVTLLEAD